jgi:type IV pilus assembly protein PilE
MSTRKQHGFTLVEMMVTVAVIALLSRIAYMSYIKQTIKGNRDSAEGALVQMAAAQERWYSTNDVYSSSTTSLKAMGSPTVSPPNGTAIYTLQVVSSTASTTGYTLEADPVSTQINKTDGKIRLDSTGKKTWDSANNGTYSSSW